MNAHHIFWIRRLIWIYFFLWIFEGALRKWILPFLAQPLLLVRDPVVLVIYFLAWRNGLFPKNAFMRFTAWLSFVFFAAGLIASNGELSITLFGLRADFLHLPLIFIIPRVFEARDVRRVGYWTLLLAMPMSLLMVLQFLSPSESWINSGADNAFQQLTSAMGHIRAPGTFSFISGPIHFYSLVAAFLLHSQFSPNLYPPRLVASAALATIMAAIVSGSRSLTVALATVFLVALFTSSLLQPRLAFRWLGSAASLIVILYCLTSISVFQEGVDVFSSRVSSAAAQEGNEGMVMRLFGDYINAWPLLFDTPLFGYGLGMGTAVGAALLTGKVQYLLAEGEWARVILESGPLLGSMFLMLRVALALWIGAISLRCMSQRDPLALLLFGAIVTPLLDGNFGQTTTLGFVICASGFCLAATRTSRVAVQARPNSTPKPLPNTTITPAVEPAFS